MLELVRNPAACRRLIRFERGDEARDRRPIRGEGGDGDHALDDPEPPSHEVARVQLQSVAAGQELDLPLEEHGVMPRGFPVGFGNLELERVAKLLQHLTAVDVGEGPDEVVAAQHPLVVLVHPEVLGRDLEREVSLGKAVAAAKVVDVEIDGELAAESRFRADGGANVLPGLLENEPRRPELGEHGFRRKHVLPGTDAFRRLDDIHIPPLADVERHLVPESDHSAGDGVGDERFHPVESGTEETILPRAVSLEENELEGVRKERDVEVVVEPDLEREEIGSCSDRTSRPGARRA